MKQYTGTKQVLGKAMTRAEYNKYRGWELPDDEDGSDPGMLVEYIDSPNSNHPDHKGYISWSPADVFDRSHRETGTFQDRVKFEKTELDEKVSKLQDFLATGTYQDLSGRERDLLCRQLACMRKYSSLLDGRIALFKGDEK